MRSSSSNDFDYRQPQYEGKNSLEEVMREENTSASLPVVTVGNIDRLLAEPEYRDRCVNRLVDIVLDIDDYRGSRRIFIP
jgi:hypothetical protein